MILEGVLRSGERLLAERRVRVSNNEMISSTLVSGLDNYILGAKHFAAFRAGHQGVEPLAADLMTMVDGGTFATRVISVAPMH